MSGSLISSGRRLQILCVDDEAGVRDLLAIALRAQGFEVEVCGNGLDAWDRLSRDPESVDLVIIDNQMPELSGLELMELLQEANFPGKVMFYSSTLAPEDTAKITRADAVVEKGTDLVHLLSAVARVLN